MPEDLPMLLKIIEFTLLRGGLPYTAFAERLPTDVVGYYAVATTLAELEHEAQERSFAEALTRG